MLWDADVEILPKPGVLDPQGETVAEALRALGFAGVRDVRVGRLIRVRVEAADAAAAEAAVDEMCRRLLANPVLESHRVAVREAEAEEAARRG